MGSAENVADIKGIDGRLRSHFSETYKYVKDPVRGNSIAMLILLTLTATLYLLGLDTRIVILTLTSATLFTLRDRLKDPYPGLFHLSLNKLPCQDRDAPPQTEWLNVGFWKDTHVFPDACKALALKLVSAARIQPESSVLDVGHGTGDSLLLLLSEPTIPRLTRLTGITSRPAHHKRSKERVERLQAAAQKHPTQVQLYLGDAVCGRLTTKHPLHPSSGVYNTILALDCAFHFHTRHKFLAQSFYKLAPGGRIALADICFTSAAVKSRSMSLTTSLLGLVPSQNAISMEEYISQMKEIGYVNVTLEDITDDVFPGWVRCLKGRGWMWWVSGELIDWYLSAGARYVVVTGSKML